MGEMVEGGNIIPDTLDGRMAIRFGHQDGDIDSLFTDDLGERDIGAFRGGLRYTGIDDTKITLTGNYLKDEGNSPFYLLRNTPGFPVSGTLTEPKSKATQGGATLTVEHEFDAFRFTSVSAYQHNELGSETDNADKLLYDQLGFPAFSARGHLDDRENIVSQEFRLNSLEGDPIRWVVGASVAHTEGRRTCVSAQCAPAPYFNTIKMDTELNSTNLGLFDDRLELDASVYYNDIDNGVLTYVDPAFGTFRTTNQDYKTSGFEFQGRMLITDGLTLTGGLGYTYSELGANGAAVNTVAGNGVSNTPQWTATTGLQYDTSAEVLNLPGWLSFGVQYQFTGSRPADVENSFDLEPYHNLYARIGWTNDANDLEF